MDVAFKTLFIDIETSPNVAFTWRVGRKISLGIENIIKERAIICISYKWAHEKKVQTLCWDKKHCDKSLLKKVSKLLTEADEVVGHNGDRFDIKFIQGRLLHHGLDPLPPLTTTDTLKLSRKKFNLNSHKLDYLGKITGNGRKLEHAGFKLWVDVVNGCKKSLNKMIKYCEQDVKLLEKVYKELTKHCPNVHKGKAVNKVSRSCPNCRKEDTLCRWGHYTTASGVRHQRFRCMHCGTGFKVPTR